MNPETVTDEEEDVTLQGGWLFADSFLALMIIFLATISFIPVLSSPESTGFGSDGAVNSKINVSSGLVLTYDAFSEEAISLDVESYVREKNLARNYEVTYTQVVGGYDPAREDAFQGNLRAINFSIQLQRAEIDVFRNSTFNVGTSELVPSGKVVLRITIVEKLR